MTSLVERVDEAVAVAAEAAAEVDRAARFPREALAALARTGLLGLALPEEVGGMGLGPAEFAEVATRLGEACASTGMVYTMHVCGTQVLVAAGADRFDGVLRRAAAGEHLATLALSERATRSSFWLSMGDSEVSNGGGRRIDVEKSFVTSAGPADGYVVSVATPGRADVADLDLVYAEATGGGIEILDWWQGAGLRGNASAPVRFRATVAPGAVVASGGSGRDVLVGTVIPWFQLGAACVSLGIARAAAAATTAHVAGVTLEHLGQRLGDQPVVRHGLGRLVTDVDVVEGFVRLVAEEMAAGDPPLRHLLQVKVAANEMALRTTDLGMRLCGGAAYSGRHPLDRHFRDARAGVVMAPTPDLLFDMIGKTAMGEEPL